MNVKGQKKLTNVTKHKVKHSQTSYLVGLPRYNTISNIQWHKLSWPWRKVQVTSQVQRSQIWMCLRSLNASCLFIKVFFLCVCMCVCMRVCMCVCLCICLTVCLSMKTWTAAPIFMKFSLNGCLSLWLARNLFYIPEFWMSILLSQLIWWDLMVLGKHDTRSNTKSPPWHSWLGILPVSIHWFKRT